MTREEAIKVVRNIYQTDAEKEALETLVPELRESEDERTRKELIEFLDGVWHLGKNANFDKWDKADCVKWIAWLKKQKECVADSSKTSADEDERIRKELIGMVKFHCADEHLDRYLNWFEKHKEQKRKFKLGDKVNLEGDEINAPLTITGIEEDRYLTDSAYGPILFGDEDNWEIVERKPAGWKQGKRIEEGDKVKIHCREDRAKDKLSIYNGKVGEVISIWDAQGNPWGPIIVRLDNGCSDGFHEDELDIFDEPPVSEKHY